MLLRYSPVIINEITFKGTIESVLRPFTLPIGGSGATDCWSTQKARFTRSYLCSNTTVAQDSQLRIESLCLQVVEATVRVVLTGEIPARATLTTNYQKDTLLKLVLQSKDYFRSR
jgi:hypothetical protein